MDDKRSRLVFRALRIALIAIALLLVAIVLRPQRFLPAGMMLTEFFQGLMGAVFLALVMAAVVARAWNDYQRKKHERK